MVATAYAASNVRGKTVRVTHLDNCGNPLSGAGGQWVGTGFITVKNTENYDTGNEVKLPNANDQIVVHEMGVVTLLNHNVSIEFVQFDTSAIPLMTGDPTVVDQAGAGLTAGWIEEMLQPRSAYFALEIWTGIADAACPPGGKQYGYWLYPFLENGKVVAGDISNKESDFTVEANTRYGTNWGKGPYDVISSTASPTVTPAWLPAVLPASASRVFFLTQVAPPTPAALAGLQVLTPVSS